MRLQPPSEHLERRFHARALTAREGDKLTMDDKIQEYDRSIRALLPAYDEMMAVGVSVLAEFVPPGAQILDLGSGSGRAAEAILKCLPETRIALLDASADALAVARHRLHRYGDRVSFHEGSYRGFVPPADVIVASLSLHFFPEAMEKTSVYRRIHDALPSNGLFLSFDLFLSCDSALRAFALRGSEPAVSPGEHYLPFVDELLALREAGFQDPECFWRRGPLAVIGACRRPTSTSM
jgi:SAM-dependent methyltransferase